MPRPPPKPGQMNGRSESDGSGTVRSRRASQKGLEWSLRSLHKIDTSAQHFLQNYYQDDSDSDGSELEAVPEDQTAYDIFKGKSVDERDNRNSAWATLTAPLRRGVVDGKTVVFELLTDVTQKPDTPRSERLERYHMIANANRSSREVRFRFWMMHFSVARLVVVFLAAFVVTNVVFAAFFYSLDGRCCGDPDFTFSQVFAFTVQTSTTIGYGFYSPEGHLANFLVVVLSYISTLLNTIFAGLLFTKYVTPVVNIQFSEVSK